MACTQVKSGKLEINDVTFPIDPCTNYWLCPNVWLDHAGDMTVDAATAKVGAPNTVKVQVFNKNQQPISNVNVEVWVCDYTLGVSPASSLASSNPGNGAMVGFTGSIASGSSAIISCSPIWTPTTADAALNGGHVCIAANCYGDSPGDDGQPLSPAGFSFCCNAHHAQRNIAVRAITQAMAKEGGFGFRFFAANPDQERELEAVLEIKEVRGKMALTRNERQLLLSGPHVKVLASDYDQCKLILAGDYAITPLRPSRFRPRELFLEGDAIGKGNSLKVYLKPGERLPLAMRAEFNSKEEPGGFYTFDVTQTNAHGEIVGGVRVMTLMTY